MAFEVFISKEHEHTVITLQNTLTGSSAEIYSFGALLNKFTALTGDAFTNVIEGFTGIDDAVNHITPYFKSAKLSPFPCRIRDGKYRFGQSNYQLSKYSSNGNAMHGLIYDQSFNISKTAANADEAMVILECTYDNPSEGFPFKYTCSICYKLTASNTLTVTTTIINNDIQLMPVADGWHPYFSLGDSINDYLFEFQSKEAVEFDESLIPTGKLLPYEEFGSLQQLGTTFFDHCYTLNFAECQPMCVVRNPLKNVQVEIYPDASYPFIQFYTPDSRKSIAIENLSAAPDAFNNGMGLKILQPSESANFSVQYVIRSL